jgi:hypothetical protein
MSNELYNKEDVYDDEISPLVQKIIEICKENKIPAIMSFAYAANEEEGTGCCTTLLNYFEGRDVPAYSEANRFISNRGSFMASIITVNDGAS